MKETTEPKKAPYTPPAIRRIDLRAEEVLSTGCKFGAQSSAGVNGDDCALLTCTSIGTS